MAARPAVPRRHPRRTHRPRPRLVPLHHDGDASAVRRDVLPDRALLRRRGAAMTLVFSLLTVQTLLGALDTLWNHEIAERLPGPPRRAPRAGAARRARIHLRIPVPGAGLARVARRMGGAHRRGAAAGSGRHHRGLRGRGSHAPPARFRARAAHRAHPVVWRAAHGDRAGTARLVASAHRGASPSTTAASPCCSPCLPSG